MLPRLQLCVCVMFCFCKAVALPERAWNELCNKTIVFLALIPPNRRQHRVKARPNPPIVAQT